MKYLKLKLIIFIYSIFGIYGTVFSQKFIYKSPPKSAYQFNTNQFLKVKNEYFRYAKNLTDYLPASYSTRGDVDYTTLIQKGIDLHESVILPDFPILINDNGLKLRDNSKVLFQQNSVLILKPSSKSQYSIILMDGVSNVKVYFPKIKGDRVGHKGTKGQWGMGIWINNSQNILVHNPYITNCWGDGIYLGNVNNRPPNKDIQIIDGMLDNNRRNGISIISGRNVEINGTFISNTNGHNPQSGIDIEPNSNEDVLDGIKLYNIKTYNNTMNGIVVSIGNLAGNTKKNIDIEIENHRDDYSYLGLSFIMSRNNSKMSMNNVTGKISVNNTKYNDQVFSPLMTYKGKKDSKVLLQLGEMEMYRKSRRIDLNKNLFIENLNKGIQYKVQ